MKNSFKLSFNTMSERIHIIGFIFILVGLIESEIRKKAGTKIGSFGLTEPNFGSDPGGMATRCKRDGDVRLDH